MKCVKCGTGIPDGELFCKDCGLNSPPELTDGGDAVHIPQPKGRMQPPKRPARPPEPQPEVRKASGAGMKTALVIVILLLVGSLGLMLWQQQELRVEKAGLAKRQADLEQREHILEELQLRIEELEQERDNLKTTVADRELKIEDLEARLSGSQSSQSQSQYDLNTKQAELDKLRQEKKDLQAEVDALEQELEEINGELDTLTKALKAAEHDQEKANFMDTYVVFVENDGSGYYHTYDCEDFGKSGFWAYSRKLAEANSYKPCPKCGGKP